MTGADRAVGTRWLVAGGLAVAAVTIAGLAAVAVAHAAGLRYGGVSPALHGPLAAAVLVTTGAAGWLLRRGERSVGGWLAAVGLNLLAYQLLMGGTALYAGVLGRRDLLATLLVAVHLGWFLPPLVLLAVTFVEVRDRLTGAAGRLRRGVAAVLLAVTVVNLVLGALLFPPNDPPFTGMGPLWVQPPGPVFETLGWILSVPWMAAMFLGPVLLWRAAARSPRRRSRLALAAASSLLPICTIVLCVLGGGLASWAGLVPVETAETALALTYGGGFLLAPVGLAAAVGGRSGWVAAAAPRLAGALVTGVLGALSLMVIVFASAVVGSGLGGGAVLPVVLATLVVAGVLVPVHRRLVRFLTLRLDPARATAAALLTQGGARSAPADTAQNILRIALADPGAELALRLPGIGGWVRPDGSAAAAPSSLPAAHTVPGPDGAPHAYVRVTGDVEDAAGPLAELAGLLDAAVLEVAVHDRDRRLAEQRARAEEATATERHRLERDLHDGVQGRLLALALELRMAQRELDDGAAQLVLTDAVDGLGTAIAELRAMVSGTGPRRLARDGLAVALAELTGPMPVPVVLDLPPRRLPPAVEILAYLVISEGVTNALKHAAASGIEVRVEVSTDGAVATVEVRDDGRGGADLRAGSGLRGLAGRVGAAGGRLVVSDRRPRGTRLEVTLPCGP